MFVDSCCSWCRACCCGFWATFFDERVFSPICVLAVHAALVADVLAYRPDLWEEYDWWSRGVRFLVGITVAVYLRTCLTEPGWVRPPEIKASAAVATCGYLAAPLACCCGAAVAAAQVRLAQQTAKERARLPPAGSEDAAAKSVVGIETSSARVGGDVVEMAEIVGKTICDEEEGLVQQPSSQHASPHDLASEKVAGIRERRCGPGGEPGLEEVTTQLTAPSGPELRWCRHCCLYQPLRTKHCRDCGFCVRTHDHHCPWVGSCIGENNRTLFYWFLVLQAAELAIFFVEGVQGISLLEPSVVLLAGLLTIAMFFIMVACLLGFHTFLMLSNLTTWEHVSWTRITYLKTFHLDGGSPFGRSMSGNVLTYCCVPRWCPSMLRRCAAQRYDDNGGIVWELHPDPRPPNCLMRVCADSC